MESIHKGTVATMESILGVGIALPVQLMVAKQRICV
jgi:hypothetical protein